MLLISARVPLICCSSSVLRAMASSRSAARGSTISLISSCCCLWLLASPFIASISARVTAEAGTTTASGSRETATATVRARPHRRNAHFLPCSFHHCLMPATSLHPEGAHHGQDQSNHHHHG